jgi:hypothetical protein
MIKILPNIFFLLLLLHKLHLYPEIIDYDWMTDTKAKLDTKKQKNKN